MWRSRKAFKVSRSKLKNTDPAFAKGSKKSSKHFMHKGEKLNSITHLVGLGLSLIGAIAIILKSDFSGNLAKLVSNALFGITVIALYAASTGFHVTRGSVKALWAKADHSGIYLLIAGTYTPLSILQYEGPMDGLLIALVWGAAVFGIFKEIRASHRNQPPLMLYLLLGWVSVAAVIPIVRNIPGHGLLWLLVGGGLYTLGVPFYVNSTRWRHAHGIWHLFVLAGTCAHYYTIYSYI